MSNNPLSHTGIAGRKALNSIDEEKRFVFAWWMWCLTLIIISVISFAGLRYAGIIAQTKVERVVFTNSQQYTEARKTEQITYAAEIAKINSQLERKDLSEATKADLRAQKAGLEVLSTVSENR